MCMENKPKSVVLNFEKEQFYKKLSTNFYKSKVKVKFHKQVANEILIKKQKS